MSGAWTHRKVFIVLAASVLGFTGCSRSHSLTDASVADAAPMDAGVLIPGPPERLADTDDWHLFCLQIVALREAASEIITEVSCRHFTGDPDCHITVGELNQCITAARALFHGAPLRGTPIPECQRICPHPDAG